MIRFDYDSEEEEEEDAQDMSRATDAIRPITALQFLLRFDDDDDEEEEEEEEAQDMSSATDAINPARAASLQLHPENQINIADIIPENQPLITTCSTRKRPSSEAGGSTSKKGALGTISDLHQPIENHNKIVGNLINEIDLENQNLDKMEINYNEKIAILGRMLEEKDKYHKTFCEGTKKVQNIVKRALDELDMSFLELENESRKLDSWSQELHRREALIEHERMKLEEEKSQNELRSNALEMAAKNRMTAYENGLRLVEKHQRDMEEALAKVRELERDRAEVQKMKIEIQMLKLECILKEMKNSGGQCVAGQQNIDLYHELLREKQEKEDELNSIKDFHMQLTAKEHQTNDELLDARKELIKVLIDMPSSNPSSNHANIGVKEMNDNQSKGCLVFELWNFEEDRKAALIEAMNYILKQWKTQNRK